MALDFLFAIHNHQPDGNFGHVFRQAYDDCYHPLLVALSESPHVKVSTEVDLTPPNGISGPFAALAAVCHRFSQEIAHDASVPFPAVLRDSVLDNLQIIETVFAKWSLEILVITYLNGAIGFQELKESLGSISARVLSVRLRQMESLGLVRREVVNHRPPRTRYSLTPEGLTVAQLGEPVFLFLRMRRPTPQEPAPPSVNETS